MMFKNRLSDNIPLDTEFFLKEEREYSDKQIDKLSFNTLNCNDFACHLFGKFPRLSFYDLYNYKDRQNVYMPQKQYVLFPTNMTNIEYHEIAHMVEVNCYSRLTIPDWGLINWGIDKNNVAKSAKGFFAGLAREIRVRAIGSIIADNIEHKYIFANSWWKYEAKKLLPFAKFNNFNDLQSWADYLCERTFAHWSKDRIETEWINRVEYISNWMETS